MPTIANISLPVLTGAAGAALGYTQHDSMTSGGMMDPLGLSDDVTREMAAVSLGVWWAAMGYIASMLF